MLPKVKVLKPDGILESTKAHQLRQQVNELVESGVKTILLDLNKVSFMDSSGLGAIVLALKTMKANGGRLFLMSINEQTKMLFDLTNMSQMFEIVADKADLEERLKNDE